MPGAESIFVRKASKYYIVKLRIRITAIDRKYRAKFGVREHSRLKGMASNVINHALAEHSTFQLLHDSQGMRMSTERSEMKRSIENMQIISRKAGRDVKYVNKKGENE